MTEIFISTRTHVRIDANDAGITIFIDAARGPFALVALQERRLLFYYINPYLL